MFSIYVQINANGLVLYFIMRVQLSGRAAPCQGACRAFESRYPLFYEKQHLFNRPASSDAKKNIHFFLHPIFKGKFFTNQQPCFFSLHLHIFFMSLTLSNFLNEQQIEDGSLFLFEEEIKSIVSTKKRPLILVIKTKFLSSSQVFLITFYGSFVLCFLNIFTILNYFINQPIWFSL